jgi:hypothetical protein
MEFVKKIEFIDPKIDLEIPDKGEIIASVATVNKEMTRIILQRINVSPIFFIYNFLFLYVYFLFF